MTVRFGLWVKGQHLLAVPSMQQSSLGHQWGLIDLFVAAALVDRIQIDNHGRFAKLVLDV